MKNLLSIFLIVLFGQCLKAQTYFPKGATWTYHLPSLSSASFSYTTIESKGDSIFNGDTLTYLEGYINCSVGTNEFVKQIGNKIYKLNKCDSTYSLLYDFGATVGDTIIINTDVCQFNDTLELRIDSIIPINVNSNILNHFYVTQLSWTSGLEFGGSFIEGIGNTVSFYPLIGFCDPAGGPLRCYNDSVIGEYNAGLYGGVCDTIFVGINEYYLSGISLYPNPTSGKISINLGRIKQEFKATVTNNLGQVIFAQQFESTDIINLEIDAPAGIYFLQIETTEGETKTLKILKK
jgi:hypothetical protein